MKVEPVEMKECPFCGGTAKIRSCKDVEFLVHSADCFIIQCDGCGCGTSYEPTEANALASWNRRASCWMDAAIEVPAHCDDVLVFRRSEGVGACIELANYKAEAWRSDDGRLLDDITHWMLLPDAPYETQPRKLQCVYCGNTDEAHLEVFCGVHHCPRCLAELIGR